MTTYRLTRCLDYAALDLRCDDFEQYFPDEFDMAEIFSFSLHNISLGSFWPDIKTDFITDNNTLPLPDISLWLDYGLLLSPAAKIYLSEMLKPYGEFLPIYVGDEQWHIFNCLTAVELDKNTSSSNSIAFKRNQVGSKFIFKCLDPENFGFYCQEKFKSAIESYGLKGLFIKTKHNDLITDKDIILAD